jgi:hypothetical protein
MHVLEAVAARRDSRRATPKDGRPTLSISRLPDGQLAANTGGGSVPVRVCRCFPWSQAAQYISLRDEKESEVALIEKLSDLDAASRAVVEIALAEAGFVLEIVSIDSAKEVFEIRAWKVQTRQGPRTFQTALDEWPREVSNGGYLVRDIAGDLFHISEPEEMDDRSQKILWALVD